MRRTRAVILIVICCVMTASASIGDTEYVYGSSEDASGPPYAALDLSAAERLALRGDGAQAVDLPFEFTWYGEAQERAWISADGALFFEDPGDGAAAACPGAGSTWSGVAAWWADLGPGDARWQVFGRYPRRAFAVQWTAPGAAGGAEGQVQAWLLEGRAEAVITLVDPAFEGDAADGVVGVAGGAGTGAAWSCDGALAEGSAAWFGLPSSRPDAASRAASALVTLSGEEEFQYAGRSLAAGDLEPDGWSDLIVGVQDDDVAFVFLGGPGVGSGPLSGADALIRGDAGDDMGSALALGDLDGDGALELALGAPSNDDAGSNAGGVWLVSGGALASEIALPDDADLALYGPSGTGRVQAGAAVALGDGDGDGYADVAVGAPRLDGGATDTGGVYVWVGGSDSLSGYGSLSASPLVLYGEAARDQAGEALAMSAPDADGRAALLVGAPNADASDGGGALSNAGRAYRVSLEGALSPGLGAVSLGAADAVFSGVAADDGLGSAVGWGDLDGDGAADVLLGAPFADTGAPKAGAAYVFFDGAAWSGAWSADDADLSVSGTEASATLGTALAAWDLSGDGADELIIAAPNADGVSSDGGVVAVYSGVGAGALTLADADHLLLGDDAAAATGTAIAAGADHDGDGEPDLFASAPFASPGGVSLAGAVYAWSFASSYTDADGDGFVAASVGGLDCDDGDAGVWPGADELLASGVDEDCDGWIDGVVIHRDVADEFAWDLAEELGDPVTVGFGFEEASAGDDVDGLYLDDDLYIVPDGDIGATGDVWGSLPSGALGARVLASTSGENGVTLLFGTPIDALSLHVLDGDGPFVLQAWRGADEVTAEIPFEAYSDNRTGGVFQGFTFAVSVDTVRLDCVIDDSWGLDDLGVVWADDTDRDGDGYTDNGGDCDDDEPAISPGADELLGDGLDNDCDGVIDGGGLELYEDAASWEAASGAAHERIDFEDAAAGAWVSDRYVDLGVEFDPALEVVEDVDGSAASGALAGQVDGGTLRLEFDELQPGVALQLLDAAGGYSFEGFAHGDRLYSFTLDVDGDDADGGVFLGVIFDYGVDAIELSADSGLEIWGIDDVRFAPLGRDDADGDGYTEAEGDCDDHDPSASPDGVEVYYDGVDGDCDGLSDFDSDGDGADDAAFGGTDCDDSSAETHPGAEDVPYDGWDSDCDGLSDYDADGDGHDDVAWGGDDCDDGDAEVSPDATEVYYDGVDADCSGTSDYDADGDGFVPSSYAGAISGDSSVSVGDCDDGEITTFPGAEDAAYDGVDSDCGGGSDFDADDDGYDALAYGGTDCDDGRETTYPDSPYERCYDGEDSDCAGDSDWDCDRDGEEKAGHGGGDCDDTDPEIYTGAPDLPRDGVDSDCDGALEFDDDADGYDGAEDGGTDCDDDDPDINPGMEDPCYDGLDQDCDGWSDYDCDLDSYDADIYGGADCDDANGAVHPGAIDYYYDGIDNDCDGEEDFDSDGDGWPADWYGGADCDDTDPSVYPGADDPPYDGIDSDCGADGDFDADGDGVASSAYGGADCDDADPEIGPTAVEIPLDGVDQDCDGIDDVDGDGDGALSAEDCDDGDAAVAPGAAEICLDGRDQDCDGADLSDCDGDGYEGLDLGGADCDDGDAAVYPGAPDPWYDGVDSDCAGDDDLDQDGDGYTIDTLGGLDCDDTDPDVNPAVALDACGGGDADCDGLLDEDCDLEGVEQPVSDTGEGPDADTGPWPGEDSGVASADTGAPEPREQASPELVDQGGCGCGVAGAPRGWAALMALGALALSRRRRSA